MNAETATLIAAIIAALSSIVTLVINLIAGRSSEFRVAYRESLNPFLTELSDEIYSTIARTKIMTQTKSEVSLENWRIRAKESKTRLKEIRLKLRYQLWGITDSMRTLALLPDWIEHARPLPNQQYSNELLRRGHSLGIALDKAILNAYNNGRHPNWIERSRVNKADQNLRDVYKRMQNDQELRELMKDIRDDD